MSYARARDLYRPTTQTVENFQQQKYTVSPDQLKKVRPQPLKLRYEEKKHDNTSHPDVFGPAFWFTLHNGSSRYPIKASPFQAEKMKGFIRGIPVMLPCDKCTEHAQTYIEENEKNLDDIVSGRESLFRFFWEFHNVVNKRNGKLEISLEDAKKMYTGEATVLSLRY